MTGSNGFDLSYDDVPYPDLCYGFTHPARLAAIGRLLDMTPAAPQRCRVLEVGCAGGGNLVPMAFSLPNSSFVGIDLSRRQIAAAEECARELDLRNVRFQSVDIMDVTPEFGEFDYIIAHGMYSWIPEAVRDQLLSICRNNLAANGIAYVSYNTFPGWHMLSMVREMMLYRTRDIVEPRARAQRARAVIEEFRSMNDDDDQSVVGSFLDAYTDTRLGDFAGNAAWQDSALLHDELSSINDPVYFHQFVRHAHEHHLQYVAEATFPQSMTQDVADATVRQLHAMAGDAIEFEQCLDYVRQQSFRRTLLCHEAVDIRRRPRAAAIEELFVTSRARATADDDGRTSFRTSDGATEAAGHPVTAGAFRHLTDVSPQAVHFAELVDEACRQAGVPPPDRVAAERLSIDLLDAATRSNQLIELLADAPVLAAHPSDRPLASPVVRLQARRATLVSNLRQEQIVLNGLGRALVMLLDGRRERADLLRHLLAMLDDGSLSSGDEQRLAARGAERRAMEQRLDADIERTLRWLGRAGLLLR